MAVDAFTVELPDPDNASNEVLRAFAKMHGAGSGKGGRKRGGRFGCTMPLWLILALIAATAFLGWRVWAVNSSFSDVPSEKVPFVASVVSCSTPGLAKAGIDHVQYSTWDNNYFVYLAGVPAKPVMATSWAAWSNDYAAELPAELQHSHPY